MKTIKVNQANGGKCRWVYWMVARVISVVMEVRSTHLTCGCQFPPSIYFIILFQNQLIMFREVAGDFSAFNAGLLVENRLEEIRAILHRSIDVTLEKRVWTRVPVELDPYFTEFSEKLHLSAQKEFYYGQVGCLLWLACSQLVGSWT